MAQILTQEHYPDMFTTIVIPVLDTPIDTAVFYAEDTSGEFNKTWVVDSAILVLSTNGTSVSAKLEVNTSAAAGGSEICSFAPTDSVASTKVGTISTTYNEVPPGSYLVLNWTGTTTDSKGVLILRMRTRLA